MKEIKNKLVDKIMLLVAVYTIGILLAVLLELFRVLGRIRILHRERFPRYKDNPELYKNGLILVSNHPSLIEPILLLALFYRDYLSHPLKFIPWSTPDKKNYYDRWYWHWLLRLVAIPIDRGNKREEVRAFFRIIKVLTSGGITILFPEGGRTDKGKEFLYSKKGSKIRTLKPGIASLILRTKASVFYIWVKGAEKVMPIVPGRLHTYPRFWKSIITIKIGKTIQFPKKANKEEIIQQIATDLLELGDEEE